MENLSTTQIAIYTMLKLTPDSMYVTPDGLHLYLLMTQGDEEGLLDIEWIYNEKDGRRFNELNGDELNVVLQDYLKEMFED